MSSWNNGGDNWSAGPSADFGCGFDAAAPSADFDGGDFGSGGFGGDNNGGEAGGDGGDRACYNCGETGHNKSDCPNPTIFTGTCRHCNQEGHQIKDCPTAPPPRCGNCKKEGHFIDDCTEPLVCPRCQGGHKLRECPEPLKCRHCEGEHMAKDCPTYVPTCKNCNQEGHMAADCTNARAIDRSHLPDITGEEAWKQLEQAINEKDMDEVKEKIQTYVKAQPATTFLELEQALRSQGYKLYLIPLVKASLSATLTNMDLQGNLGKKYTVNYRFSDQPRRVTEKEGWPKDHAEVLARLVDSGDVVPLGRPKCSNCSEIGHISRSCPQERTEPADRATVKCYNCGEEGHRVRDCPIPRVDKFACKNCGKGGHKAAECPEPRSAEGVECRKCNEVGHFSKDCPKAGPRGCRNCGQEGHMAKECTEPRNMDLVQCRNCDQMGHTSRDCTEPRNMSKVQCRNCDEMGHDSKTCPKPRDYSRVKCQNCQQMGHTKVRCNNPHVDEAAGGDGGFGGDGAFSGGGDFGGNGGFSNDAAPVEAGGESWTTGGSGGGGGMTAGW